MWGKKRGDRGPKGLRGRLGPRGSDKSCIKTDITVRAKKAGGGGKGIGWGDSSSRE